MNTELIHIQHQVSSMKLPSFPKTAVDWQMVCALERLLEQIVLLEKRVEGLEDRNPTDNRRVGG